MRLLLLIFFFIAQTVVSAQKKDWVNYDDRTSNYSNKLFFTGFVSQYVKKKSNLNSVKGRLMSNAKTALSESIKVNIESSIINEMHNLNSVSIEDFKKISRSYSRIEITGIQTDFYLSKNKKEAFAFAWVRKTKVRSYYRKKIANTLTQVRSKINQADEFMGLENRVSAINALQDALVLIRNTEEAQTVLIVCGENDQSMLAFDETLKLGSLINKKINLIKSNHNLNLNELATYMVNQLNLKGNNVTGLQLENVFYQDTKMSSQLSARLNDILKLNITNKNIAIVEEVGFDDDDLFTIEGSYWRDSTELQIIMNLFQRVGRKRVLRNSAEGWVKLKLLKEAKLEFEPTNYEEAISKNQILNENVISGGGSTLGFWTNKGAKGPVFKQGDVLKVFVNTTRPGYLRLINYWANGSQLLLEDNYFISADNTGKNIELPIAWETSCPCGIEYLQVIVQSEPFDKLKTEDVDGFLFLKSPIKEIVRSSRGFKDKLTNEGAHMAEKTISLTTLE